MQHHAADKLDIEVALAKHALGRFTHRGKSGNQQVFQALAIRELFTELGRSRLQLIIGELGQFRLHGVDRGHLGAIGLQAAVIGRSEQRFGERAEHATSSLFSPGGGSGRRGFARDWQRRPK